MLIITLLELHFLRLVLIAIGGRSEIFLNKTKTFKNSPVFLKFLAAPAVTGGKARLFLIHHGGRIIKHGQRESKEEKAASITKEIDK